MDTVALKEAVNKLPLAKKVEFIHSIMDDIFVEKTIKGLTGQLSSIQKNDIAIPQWQKDELDRRLESYQSGNMKTYSATEVHENLRAKLLANK